MNNLLNFKARLKQLEGCCLIHPQDFNVDNIVGVLHWDSEDDGYENTMYEAAIARTADDKFLAFEGDEDSSGHG